MTLKAECSSPSEPLRSEIASTLRAVTKLQGAVEDLLWDLADQLEPEDGKLWVHDIDEGETLAFIQLGIETLREIIKGQIDHSA